MMDTCFSLSKPDVKRIDSTVLDLVPEDFAIKHRILPFMVQDGLLYIAMEKKEAGEIIARLRLITNMKVSIVEYKSEDLDKLIFQAYKHLNFLKAIENLKNEIKTEYFRFSNSKEPESNSNAPGVKILNHIINTAIERRASDIHFEPYGSFFQIRYRIDGSLCKFFQIPIEVYGTVTSRLKVLAHMDISEKRAFQDGKCKHFHGNKEFDLRVSSIPVVYGEKFVVRILDKSNLFISLDKIYYKKEQNKLVKNFLMKGSGIILTTGPTGSGKSTTLYAMLKELNKQSCNITTIENPVEYTMKGVNQINVNPKAGITFAAGLRSVLRQDPDIIMLGEIRDEQTAAIAIRAAITGHLVLSTLHTRDAKGAITRLLEMGVEKYLLADALIALIAQRLVRKICPKCKESYYPSHFEKEILSLSKDKKLFRGKGCSDCNYSGYSNRQVISEIISIDEDWRRKLLLVNNNFDGFRIKKKDSLQEQCKALVIAGITTSDEFIKVYKG
ncbi:MAG: type II/IV secretion system protein [Clostridia bacterium]|jgi:type IV pilus assembly protein PilB|nr:type II/IV secretion system protein [Clostridia bacterium]